MDFSASRRVGNDNGTTEEAVRYGGGYSFQRRLVEGAGIERDGSGNFHSLRTTSAVQPQAQFFIRNTEVARPPSAFNGYNQRNTAGTAIGAGNECGVMRMSLTDKFGYQSSAAAAGGQGYPSHEPCLTQTAHADDTRDRIIATYRDEIKNHQARDRDYKILQDVMADLQRNIRGLESEI
jgi:hypothetical protein